MRFDPEGRLCGAEDSERADPAVASESSNPAAIQGDMETDMAPTGDTAGITGIKPLSPVKQLQIDASGRLAIGKTGLCVYQYLKEHEMLNLKP